MVGRRLEAGARIAGVALLALSSVAPLNPTLLAVTPIAPVADTSGCPVTVGTAITESALAADAARALAVGYATTDCLPDAQLLEAAEARAAIPMESSTPTQAAVGGSLAGTSSSGSAAAFGSGGVVPLTPTASPSPIPATDTTTPTPTETTTTGTTTTETSSTETSSNDGLSGTDSDGAGSTSDGSTSDGSTSDGSTSDESSSDRSDSGTTDDDSDSGSPGTTPDTVTDGSTADGTTTAAGKLGWGTAAGIEDFDGQLTNWGVYNGPGHAGKGRRSPDAMTVNGGILTITGDSNGTTGGMAWRQGRSKYGRWEARIKSPVADPSYNAVMLLWPDAENWPVGGEVDFMEIGDETRQKTDFFLHYGEENHQLHGQVQIDATQWHNWAVEWSPTKITAYVDGNEWYSTTQASALPPGSMHLTLQLDWFPKGGAVQQSAMHVDWVRYYPIAGVGDSGVIQNSPDNTSDTGVTLNSLTNPGSTGGADGGSTNGTDGGTTNGTDGESVAGTTTTTTVALLPEATAPATSPTQTPAGTSTGTSTTTAAGSTTAALVTVTKSSSASKSSGGEKSARKSSGTKTPTTTQTSTTTG